MFSKQCAKSVHFTTILALCWDTMLPNLCVREGHVRAPGLWAEAVTCPAVPAAGPGDLWVSKYLMVSCTSPFKLKTSICKHSLLPGSNLWFVNALEINLNKAITSKGKLAEQSYPKKVKRMYMNKIGFFSEPSPPCTAITSELYLAEIMTTILIH